MNMQHQTHTTTKLNRYPEIFKFISLNFSGSKNILSFGCSSGEECFTLREYFPESNITGVDLNAEMIVKAITNNKFKNINFLNYLDNKNYYFDCIFAMSIFCRWPETDSLDKNLIYKFNDFNKEIMNLDSNLKPGGVLVVFNSNYYFLDTDVAHKYVPVNSESFEKEFVRKFDKFGNYCNNQSPVIFIKQEEHG